MAVPIENLQLQTLLSERVLVKWVNQAGTPVILGSCLPNNKEIPGFVMKASCDMEGYIHIHFSLEVAIKTCGKDRKMEMLLVVPPDADFASASMPLPIPPLDAYALHEAGVRESENFIVIRFDLTQKGFVLMQKKKAPTIRPCTRTSNKLIHSLKSLSDTTIFSVYIRPNDYARVGLNELCKRLTNTGASIRTGTHKANMKEMYIQEGAVLVEWNKFIYRNGQEAMPPSQIDNRALVLREVQVPRSPPINLERETPLVNSIEEVIEETPTPAPISRNSTPVLHGMFSPSIEELLDGEANMDDIEEEMRAMEIDLDVDSDEEFLANLNARELSQQIQHDLEVSKMLKSMFVEWINGAIAINPNMYEHKRLITKLLILGNCVRTSNARVFDATRPWCSALLFYDPFDSDDNIELWEERNRWLISDMARLIKWANGFHSGAEISSVLIDDFVKLGRAARTAALHPRHYKAEYRLQKSVCVARVLFEFGRQDAMIGRDPGN